MNVSDLQMVLGLSYSTNNSTLSDNKEIDPNLPGGFSEFIRLFLTVGIRGGDDDVCVLGAKPRMSRRHSMENLELMKLTPEKMNVRTSLLSVFTCCLFKFLSQIICCFVSSTFLYIEGAKLEQ